MKIGIDYGRTINRHPEVFSKLTKWLRQSGHQIYIISGRNYGKFSGDNIEKQVVDSLKESLSKYHTEYDYITPHDDRLHTDIDKGKGKQCKEYGIDIMFDDDDGYINDIKRWSPNTEIIKVKNENL